MEYKTKHMSSIQLDSKESVWVDDGKKSVAYFCKNIPARIDKNLLSELKKKMSHIGNRNLRVCLHTGPNEPFHSMIILERKGKYYRPHKHLKKGESFHILEGSMGVLSFDKNGNVLDSCVLNPAGNIIYRVGVDAYHAVMPMSDLVVYHESKQGPFIGEGDSIYPSWAPNGTNTEEAAEYTNNPRKALEN